MYKVGTSSRKRIFDDGYFRILRESHIDAIEICIPYDMYEYLDYKKIKKSADLNGIELWSYHLPFVPFSQIEPSASDKNIRKRTIEYHSELIKKASEIGINKFVIHPSGEPIDDSVREERIKFCMDTLNELAEFAHKYGGVIAVENLPRTCLGKNSEEIKKLISCNDKLKACFDTNHLLSETPDSFMTALKNDIITVHISDYDYIDEKHWLPGEGQLDWSFMLEKFKEINYNGVWMYEVPIELPPKDIVRSRELNFSDLYDNAMAIFNKTEFPVI